ncbi:MAG: hypothetical protein HN413_05400, partial [Chloroflexi bacterium]|nr:hypothetical protein [Chloroflexota bacterium]
MKTKWHKRVWILIVLALLLVPLGVSAEGEPPPTPQPAGRITAPGITGVNPEPEPEEGELTELDAPGGVAPLGSELPVSSDAPRYVEITPLAVCRRANKDSKNGDRLR